MSPCDVSVWVVSLTWILVTPGIYPVIEPMILTDSAYLGICKSWKRKWNWKLEMEIETGNDRQNMEMVVRQSLDSSLAWGRENSPGNSVYASIALSSGSPIFSTDIVLEVGTMMTVT